MTGEIKARATLLEKVRFEGRGHTDVTVTVDYPAPRGDDRGLMPLELLLVSLATCSGQVILGILARMRQAVDGLEIEASGRPRDEHPAVLTGIDLCFTFRGDNLDPAAIERALTLAEEQYCPVWAMLRPGTPIRPSFTIVQQESAHV
jgi:putative redox protein